MRGDTGTAILQYFNIATWMGRLICCVPYDATDPGDMVDSIPEHHEVHGLLALAVELSQVFLHDVL